MGAVRLAIEDAGLRKDDVNGLVSDDSTACGAGVFGRNCREQ